MFKRTCTVARHRVVKNEQEGQVEGEECIGVAKPELVTSQNSIRSS
jgi:hypothetical protein